MEQKIYDADLPEKKINKKKKKKESYFKLFQV